MKVTSNDILKVCAGIATVVLAFAAFNFSIAPAHATPPTPQEFIQSGTDKIGKYQMSMSVATQGDKTMWAVIVWDTETGQSRTYYDNTSMSFGPSFNISRTSPAGN
ncbi:MAG: hypothetical protein RL007_2094 [Bacteroidota bacterium]|jgi:hypothetical protein